MAVGCFPHYRWIRPMPTLLFYIPIKKEFVCVSVRVEIMLCVSFTLSLLPTYLYHI